MLVTSISAGLFLPTAFAHTELIGSNPSSNSTLTRLPRQISLTFGDPLLTLGKSALNQVRVTDPMNSVITSASSTVKGAVLRNVLRPKRNLLGKYTVTYRVSAEDGHVVQGRFTFTLAP
jgi:methionine-rich copper-binding protein CopC